MAEARAVSIRQRDDREPIIRVSVPQSSLHTTTEDDDDDDYTLYGDGDSYLDLSEELALCNIYNELEIPRIYKSFGIVCPEELNYLNNACGRNRFKIKVTTGTQTEVVTGNIPLSWIVEVKDKTDCIYTEISNIINTLLHSPDQSWNDKSSLTLNKFLKQEGSEDQNKNMKYWFHENGAWKSLLHPGIQIPCSVATKAACASKETPSKWLEEKLKNILKIVVGMKNIIPVVSDKMETQPQLADNLFKSEQNISSALPKLNRGVQTEKFCVDVATSTLIPITETQRVESISSSRPVLTEVPINYKCQGSSTRTELESSVSYFPEYKSKINFEMNQEQSNSCMPINRLLTPIRERFGSGGGIEISENQDMTVGAGESLYTFSPKPDTKYMSGNHEAIVGETSHNRKDNSGTQCTSWAAIVKGAVCNPKNCTKNDQNIFAGANKRAKESGKAKQKLNSAPQNFTENLKPSDISLNSHNIKGSGLCIAKKSRNQPSTKCSNTSELNDGKVVRQRQALPPTSKVQESLRHNLSEISVADKSKTAEGVSQKNVAKGKSTKSSIQRVVGLTFGKGNSSQNSSKSAQRRGAQDNGTVTSSNSKDKIQNSQPLSSIYTLDHHLVKKPLKEGSESAARSETGIIVSNSEIALKSVAGPSKDKPSSKKEDRTQTTGAIARDPKPISANKRYDRRRVFER